MPVNFPVEDSTLSAKLPASLGSKPGAASLSVVLASDQVMPLPAGAASGAKQDTAIAALAAIASSVDGLEAALAKGQTSKAGSLSVTLALDQGTLPIADAQATPSYAGVVTVTAAITPLLAANNARRRFIATNPKASTAAVGLSVKNDATFAQCEIILSAGDSWVEALCAGAAWYAITESGSISVPVQTAV